MTFPTTGILDNFNRANENPMTGWTDLAGGFQVNSNQAANESAGTSLAFWNAATYGADSEAFITIATKPANGEVVAIYARLKDTGSVSTLDGYSVRLTVQSGTDTVIITRLDNAVETTLGATINQEFNAGDKLGISVIGSTITAWRHDGSSWTNLGSRTDATYSAAGRLGIVVNGTTVRLDDFGGGTYVEPPPPPDDTVWTIAVDWDRDGSYAETYDDVTSRVISANWFLGFRRPYKDVAHDSMLDLVLRNTDKRYSPENSASPLFGKVAPFRTIRVQSDDGVTTRTHWIGWIEKIEPDVGVDGKRTVRLTAAGPMVFFEAAETAIELQENQRTDQIIDRLLGEVVVPPAMSAAWFLGLAGYSELDISARLANVAPYTQLDTGAVTLAIAADNWVKRGGDSQDTFNVYRAIADVVAAERGRFLFDREGKALFWNRTRLQDEIVSSLTLDNTMPDLEYTYAGMEDFKNEIILTCHPRSVGASADEVLWELTDPITVQPGKTTNFGVKYQDDTTGNARIGAKDVVLADVTVKSGNAEVTIESKANSANLKIVNTGTIPAVLSSAKVKGRKITDYGRMEAKAQDGESIARYGRRSMKLNFASVDSLEEAQYIADHEITRRGEPRGMITQVTLKSHSTEGGDYHADQLARTLGDVLTISETQTQHTNRRYLIIGEAHRLTKGLLETTWYLEPAAEAPFPWKLDVEDRAELDTAAYLAF